jgi:uncharacterized membrane protein YwzB
MAFLIAHTIARMCITWTVLQTVKFTTFFGEPENAIQSEIELNDASGKSSRDFVDGNL